MTLQYTERIPPDMGYTILLREICRNQDISEEILRKEGLKEFLQQKVNGLPWRERRYIEVVCFEGKPTKEACEELYLTGEGLRQRRIKAMRRLRHHTVLSKLRNYMQ